MKKFFLILFVLSCSISFGQIISGYGVKVGLTSSQFKWDYSIKSGLNGFDIESDRKPGINIGLFAEILDSPFFSLNTELNYISKGFQNELFATTSESPDIGNKVLWKVNFNYIDVSVLAKPKINLDILTPYILIGPRVDIELSKSAQFDNPDNYKEYSSQRLGFKFGIGTEVTLFGMNFLSELVWDFDFREIYKNENVKVITNSYDIRIGIKL
jgi:hypothetical protein